LEWFNSRRLQQTLSLFAQ
jgi:hypothetical protein